MSIEIEQGSCVLNHFEGNAFVFTSTGDIHVLAKPTVWGKGFSNNGKVKNTLLKNGIFFIEATSKNGDIYLEREN